MYANARTSCLGDVWAIWRSDFNLLVAEASQISDVTIDKKLRFIFFAVTSLSYAVSAVPSQSLALVGLFGPEFFEGKKSPLQPNDLAQLQQIISTKNRTLPHFFPKFSRDEIKALSKTLDAQNIQKVIFFVVAHGTHFFNSLQLLTEEGALGFGKIQSWLSPKQKQEFFIFSCHAGAVPLREFPNVIAAFGVSAAEENYLKMSLKQFIDTHGRTPKLPFPISAKEMYTQWKRLWSPPLSFPRQGWWTENREGGFSEGTKEIAPKDFSKLPWYVPLLSRALESLYFF